MTSPDPNRQARGTTLLSLRCEDIEGGLLGRSLLSLVSNKGYVGQGGGGKGCAPQAPLLPPHKFSPHDVVALRPSKGAADGPSLVQVHGAHVLTCVPTGSSHRPIQRLPTTPPPPGRGLPREGHGRSGRRRRRPRGGARPAPQDGQAHQ